MHKLFTWERGPFEMCPNCHDAGTFGILSAGGNGVTKRCTRCRYSHTEELPTLNKKVVYLDQFVFSELHKLRAGTRKNDGRTAFWSEANQLLDRAMLLQQLVLPHSNIHHRETIVSPFPGALRATQETIGGDIRLRHTNDIQLRQAKAFARAFFADEEPAIEFDAGEAIDGIWNEWLSDMHVTVGTDWSSFVPETRQRREASHSSVSNLVEGWRTNRLGFGEVLEIELGSYYQSRIDEMAYATEMFEKHLAENCPLRSVKSSFAQQEFELIYQLAREAGIPEALRSNAVMSFWKSSKNCNQPFGRILAYLFAALAGQIKGGRLKMPTAGFLNDVQAISAYAPYLDAMFIDNECAELLRHPQCLKNLNYKAEIFSFTNADKFLNYLRSIIDSTPDDVRAEAKIIYGF